jgi:hypothetical protein
MLRKWRRLDQPGLEVLRIEEGPGGLLAHSTIIDAGDEPLALTYEWRLDSAWRTQVLMLSVESAHGERGLLIERIGPTAWKIDGRAAPEFDGCLEPDVSATPFCNGLAIRALAGEGGELTALYVPADSLRPVPSAQRYERQSDRQWRYIDKGVAAGFEADLKLDADGLVSHYEGLFEAMC